MPQSKAAAAAFAGGHLHPRNLRQPYFRGGLLLSDSDGAVMNMLASSAPQLYKPANCLHS
eukprot:5730914-Amphidinium_carterae.1